MNFKDILRKVPIIGWLVYYKQDTARLKQEYFDNRERDRLVAEQEQILMNEKRLARDAKTEEFLKSYAGHLAGLTNLQVFMEQRKLCFGIVGGAFSQHHKDFAASATKVYEAERNKRKVMVAEHLVKLLNSTDEEVLLLAESMKERRTSEDYVEATREEARNRVANRVGVRTLRRLIDEEKQKLKARL